MRKNRQLFFEEIRKIMGDEDSRFGGSLLKKSHAQKQRPIATNQSMHTVLRSSLCKGKTALTDQNNLLAVQIILDRQAKRHRIRLYKMAIAYNHIHLILKTKSRDNYQSFIRAVSGLIPRHVLGVQKGNAKGIKFWDQRPWSRIVSWGREFRSLLAYLEKNTLEAIGFGCDISASASRCISIGNRPRGNTRKMRRRGMHPACIS